MRSGDVSVSDLPGYATALAGMVFRQDGTWGYPPGYEFDYAQITTPPANVTATTEAGSVAQITGNSVTYPNQRVVVNVFVPRIASANGSGTFNFIGVIYRDSTVLGNYVLVEDISGSWDDVPAIPYVSFIDTPSAGAHTYKFSAYLSSAGQMGISCGAGGSGTEFPAYLRVTAA